MTLPPEVLEVLGPYNRDNLDALAVTEKHKTRISGLFRKDTRFMRLSINDQTIEHVGPPNDDGLIVLVTNVGNPFVIKDTMVELPFPLDGIDVLHNVGMGGFVKVKFNVQLVRPFTTKDFDLITFMQQLTDGLPPLPL